MLRPLVHTALGDPARRGSKSLSTCGEGCKLLAPGWEEEHHLEITQVSPRLILGLTLAYTF